MSSPDSDVRTDNRYDIWKCAKCNRLRHQRALPHEPPVCCGTGMWYQGGYEGPAYEWVPEVES